MIQHDTAFRDLKCTIMQYDKEGNILLQIIVLEIIALNLTIEVTCSTNFTVGIMEY